MGYEDYTTYTEYDPNNRYDVAAQLITVSGLTRNEDAYIYSDKDTDHFGDFSHIFDVKGSSGNSYNDLIVCWMLSNAVDDLMGLLNSYQDFLGLTLYEFAEVFGTPRLQLRESDGGTQYIDNSIELSRDTWYYIKIEKSVTTYTCKIYSDAARTNLVETLALSLHHDYSFRYIFAVNSVDTNNSTYVASGYIGNLDLQEVSTYTKTFKSDAFLEATQTKTLTTDALLEATSTKTFTSDAYLLEEAIKTLTADAILEATIGKPFTADAILQLTTTKTLAADAHLRQVATKTFALDSILKATYTKIFAIDAYLTEATAKTFNIDALLEATLTKTTKIDALLQQTSTKTTQLDAHLQQTTTKTVKIDALLQEAQAASFTADAILTAIAYTKTFTTDAYLRATFTKTFGLDAILQAAAGVGTYGSPAPRPTFPIYLLKLIRDYVAVEEAAA